MPPIQNGKDGKREAAPWAPPYRCTVWRSSKSARVHVLLAEWRAGLRQRDIRTLESWTLPCVPAYSVSGQSGPEAFVGAKVRVCLWCAFAVLCVKSVKTVPVIPRL